MRDFPISVTLKLTVWNQFLATNLHGESSCQSRGVNFSHLGLKVKSPVKYRFVVWELPPCLKHQLRGHRHLQWTCSLLHYRHLEPWPDFRASKLAIERINAYEWVWVSYLASPHPEKNIELLAENSWFHHVNLLKTSWLMLNFFEHRFFC